MYDQICPALPRRPLALFAARHDHQDHDAEHGAGGLAAVAPPLDVGAADALVARAARRTGARAPRAIALGGLRRRGALSFTTGVELGALGPPQPAQSI